MSTVQIQNDIIDDFKILDGDLEMTLNYLMELGESLNDLDEKYKIDDNLVKGCQSKVWLKCTKEDDKIYLEGDSNTAITKGLLSILIKIFNKKTPEEIADTNLFFINEIGLNRFIGTQRSNGLESMEKKIKLLALTL
jgi:cysteine desulfuration protein SufE|tara:strand:+ start:927 stop:1337 length:411 start_codon:yes stop_codon:yes gene_type:complete